MEKINFWCRLITLVSVISSAIITMIPECSLKKAFNTFVSMILFFSFAVCFIDSDSISLSLEDKIHGTKDSFNKEIDDYANSAIIVSAQNETEIYISKIMSNYNIEGKCKVICSFNENKIVIEKIDIEANIKNQYKDSILSEIEKICSDETEIIINGEIIYERNF